MPLACATSATAGSYKLEQRHRLRHAFQVMCPALLGDKETDDLTLHLRCHKDRARFCQRLHPRGGVGRIAVNLTRRIDHYLAGFYSDARAKRWLARTGILAVDLSKRALNGQGGPCCAFSIVFLRRRITK